MTVPVEAPSSRASEAESAVLGALPTRYRVVRRLGGGGEKAVFLAEDSEKGGPVAIAVFPPAESRSAEREIEALSRLGEHPNISKRLDVCRGASGTLIVSEYVAGGDLGALVHGRGSPAIPIDRSLDIGIQICAALEHAHRAGVVHGDLKPGNVLLDTDGRVVLADFGLALLDSQAVSGSTDVLSGTAMYLAPERITGEGISHHADLYGLGCILYELLTGRPLFNGAASTELLQNHHLKSPPALILSNPAIPCVLSDLVLQLLAKDPRQRPSSSLDVRMALEGIASSMAVDVREEVSSADPSPAPEAPRGSSSSAPMVGRTKELALLDAKVRAAERGIPGTVLLHGEAGIGKSRLLLHAESQARSRGAIVLSGRGRRTEGARTSTIPNLLRPMCGRLSELDEDDAELIRRLLSGDAALPAPGGSLRTIEREYGRAIGACARALQQLARGRFLVLSVDDLDRADDATLHLFEDLTAATSGRDDRVSSSLLLLGTHRDVDTAHHSAAVLSAIARPDSAAVIELPRLDESSVYDFLQSRGMAQPSDRIVELALRSTRGNPLFLEEWIGDLKRRGSGSVGNEPVSGLMFSSELQVPVSIQSMTERRLEELAPGVKQVLATASVVGTTFDSATVRRLLGDEDACLDEALHKAVGEGLLLRHESGEFAFSSWLVRDGLYGRLSSSERAQLHLRVGEALASRAFSDPDRLMSAARHLIGARPLGDRHELFRVCSAAGRRALAVYAWNEAVEFLSVAAEAALDQEVSLNELAEIHRQIGYAYYNRFEAAPCVRHFDEAIDLFRQDGDLIGLARALNDRSRTLVMFGNVGYGQLADVRPLESVLTQLGQRDPLLRARILNTLAESYWAATDTSRALSLAREALALARGRDDALCAEINTSVAISQLQSLHLVEALGAWREGLHQARRSGDMLAIEQCLHRLPIALYMMGKLDEAVETAREAQAINATVRNSGDSSLGLAILASVAAVRGDFAGSERFARETIEVVRRSRYPWAGVFVQSVLAWTRVLRNDIKGARDAIDLTLKPGYLLDDPAALESTVMHHRVLIDVYGGEVLPKDIDRMASSVPPTADLGYDIAFLPGLCAVVEIAQASHRPDLVAGIPQALDRAANRGAILSIAWPHVIARVQGIAATLELRFDDAQAHFESAMEISHEIGSGPESSRTALDFAEMLALRNEENDRLRARSILTHAKRGIRSNLPHGLQARFDKLATFLERA